MFLENRSILFFSAQAFGYQNEIRAEMERMGARVDYFDERPANSFAVKAAIRINRNLLARYIDRYHARIIERTKNRKYDYVFFIKGESVSVENLNKIKELHPEAKLIIYHWDSIANNRNALRILPVFDRAFSFDKPDCEKLGIRFLCQNGQFELLDQQDKRLYFSVDHGDAAAQALMKALFPLNR